MKAKVISVQFTDILQVSTTVPPATKLVLKVHRWIQFPLVKTPLSLVHKLNALVLP